MDLRLAAGVVGLNCPPLSAERLHDANARETFLQDCERLGDPVADRVVDASRAVVERPARGNQDRQRNQRDGRERRREDDQRHHGQRDLKAAADDLDQRFADELGQRLDVRGQP